MRPINNELELLGARGHKVQANPGACVVGGAIHILIDGELRSASEIHETAAPIGKDVYGFDARGKQYEVYINYLYGGMAYEIHQGGKKLGAPRPPRRKRFGLRSTDRREHGQHLTPVALAGRLATRGAENPRQRNGVLFLLF
jgi:hypothetical protein